MSAPRCENCPSCRINKGLLPLLVTIKGVGKLVDVLDESQVDDIAKAFADASAKVREIVERVLADEERALVQGLRDFMGQAAGRKVN